MLPWGGLDHAVLPQQNMDGLYGRLYGPGSLPIDMRRECYSGLPDPALSGVMPIPQPQPAPRKHFLSHIDTSTPVSPTERNMPLSPSYARTAVRLKARSDALSINEMLGAAWDESPAATPVSASAGSYPHSLRDVNGSGHFAAGHGAAMFAREANGSMSGASNLEVDALVTELLNEADDTNGEASPSHLALFNRGRRVGPTVDTNFKASLAPLVMRPPASPCAILNNSFGRMAFSNAALQSPSGVMNDRELREMLNTLDSGSKESSSLD